MPQPLNLNTAQHVTIIDAPCGTGKTTRMLSTFKPSHRYLVVVPFLSEVERVLKDAAVPFVQPEVDEVHPTKCSSLESFIANGANIVTTHKLFTALTILARSGELSDYDIVVDEVLDVVKAVDGAKPRSFEEFYIKAGYAKVTDDGLVLPTTKWDAEWNHVDDALDVRLYKMAKAGSLYIQDDVFFLWALPPELLQAGRSFTVYTYLAEGSVMLSYLRKLGIAYQHVTDPLLDMQFRRRASSLITVKSIPSLEATRFTFTGQTESQGRKLRERKVATALKNLRHRELRTVPLSNILVTSVKSQWFKGGRSNAAAKPKPTGFSSGSKLFSARWVSNTTRGTNDYVDCSHAIYLYDQRLNPYVKRWVGLGSDPSVDDQYATTELIQWLYRTRLRRGLPVTVYIPSARMRHLLNDWLHIEKVSMAA